MRDQIGRFLDILAQLLGEAMKDTERFCMLLNWSGAIVAACCVTFLLTLVLASITFEEFCKRLFPMCGECLPDTALGTLFERAKTGRFCGCGFWIAPSWNRLYGNTTAGKPVFPTVCEHPQSLWKRFRNGFDKAASK